MPNPSYGSPPYTRGGRSPVGRRGRDATVHPRTHGEDDDQEEDTADAQRFTPVRTGRTSAYCWAVICPVGSPPYARGGLRVSPRVRALGAVHPRTHGEDGC